MGYLTTVTIRNDALGTIKDNKDDFIEKLLYHCSSCGMGAKEYFSVGNHANPVVLQMPRHADDRTIYVHAGNTVVDMNPFGNEAIEMAKRNPKFFDEVLAFMEGEVKALKKLRGKRSRL